MSLLRAKEVVDEGSRVGDFSKLLGRVGSLWALELDRQVFLPILWLFNQLRELVGVAYLLQSLYS